MIKIEMNRKTGASNIKPNREATISNHRLPNLVKAAENFAKLDAVFAEKNDKGFVIGCIYNIKITQKSRRRTILTYLLTQGRPVVY